MAFKIDLSKKNETGGKIVFLEAPQEPLIIRTPSKLKKTQEKPPAPVNHPANIKHD